MVNVNEQLADANPLTGCQLRLPTFEGPLDVLLRLIERSQLAITDVSLIAVTDQFLAYLDDAGDAPPAAIAEFAAVGARLVLLKSRSLLPRPPVIDDEPDPADLVHQLIAYRTVKEAARHLSERDARGAGAFGREMAGIATPAPPALLKLAACPPNALARALRRRLAAVATPPAAVATRRLVTLREMVERVLAALQGRRPVSFRAVAMPGLDRHEVLTAFLAVLVLVRRRVVDAEQTVPFGEIVLRRSAPAAEALPADALTFAADD